MTRQKHTPEYVTREVLKEEISASEKRLEAKITGLDVKVDNVGKRLEAKFTGLEAKVDNVDKRLEAKFTGLDAKVDKVEKRLGANIIGLDVKVDNVEKRLEANIIGLDVKVDSVEKHLDARIETTSRSLKDYTDSRVAPVMSGIHRLEETMKQQGAKMDRYYEGIVRMIEGVVGKVVVADDLLKDHEVRTSSLEGRGR